MNRLHRRRQIRALDRRVGALIREIRRRHGDTLTEAAEVLGVTYQQMQKYESGSNRISAIALCVLLKHWNEPVDGFVGRLTLEMVDLDD
ncbi:MAG: helix-turn-helix transcriptional regulator [Planctomycetota bacterium]